jgi:hypothetical protein
VQFEEAEVADVGFEGSVEQVADNGHQSDHGFESDVPQHAKQNPFGDAEFRGFAYQVEGKASAD